MKLLYTLTAYPPSTGGAQLYAHALAQEVQHHHEVEVISIWDRNRTDWLLGTTARVPSEDYSYCIDGICVHRVGLSSKEKLHIMPYVLGYYPLMKYAVPPIAECWKRKIKPYAEGVELVHNVRIGREPLSYASLRLAQEKDVPFVFTPLHHPRWVGWRYRMYTNLYQMADMVFCLTHAEKGILVDLGVRAERIVVTGMGPILAPTTDSAVFLDKYNIDGPFILFLGQHYMYKGYKEVLESAELVWQKIPEAHFVFIGPPVGQSEQDFTNKSDRRIHRLGKVGLQEKSDALAACTILCVPSMQESFGGVYTEAWSYGKPVVGCNIPAVSEVIDDEVNGYLVEQNSDAIAEKVIFLLQNPQKANDLGTAGKEKLENNYTWSRLSEATEKAYQSLF